MNIFFLDRDPIRSAEMHHDKHVVKMILEYAQLLSTAHRVLDGELYIDSSSGRKIKRFKTKRNDDVLYKATHMNHPSAIWARESSENYIWLYRMFAALSHEYTYRYGKVHATWEKLGSILSIEPNNIKQGRMTEIPQAMPEQYHNNDSLIAYRRYYLIEKKSQSKYTNRDVPSWLGPIK
jgi:hypothetical protein